MSTAMSPMRWTRLGRVHPALIRLRKFVGGLQRSEAKRELERVLRKWGSLVDRSMERNEARSEELEDILLELRLACLLAHRLSANHRLPIDLTIIGRVTTAWDDTGEPPPLYQRMWELGKQAALNCFPEFAEALSEAIAEFHDVSQGLNDADRAFDELRRSSSRADHLVRAYCAEHGLPLNSI